MLFQTNGCRDLNQLEKAFLAISETMRGLFAIKVRLNDKGFASTYLCTTKWDAKRVMSLWVKEEGTMRWIDSEATPGSVFMDIGANVGVYSIAAAHRVGPSGKVYSFEPHRFNAATLMQNVMLSKLTDRMTVFTSPVSDQPGVIRFNYASLKSASSGSQLGHSNIAGKDRSFSPVASEMMSAVSVDWLIAQKVIEPPTLVKIDVDGNEPLILRGMRGLLSGPDKPKAVQVEINVGQDALINAFMNECGYRLDLRHFTPSDEVKLKKGASFKQISHNAIFRRKEQA